MSGAAPHAGDADGTCQSRAPAIGAAFGVHAIGPALAAAVATVEEHRSSGADTLPARLLGIEVACKVLDATDAVDIDNSPHTTGIGGQVELRRASRICAGSGADRLRQGQQGEPNDREEVATKFRLCAEHAGSPQSGQRT